MDTKDLELLVAGRLRDIILSEEWFREWQSKLGREKEPYYFYTLQDLARASLNSIRTGICNSLFHLCPVEINSLGKLYPIPGDGVRFEPDSSFCDQVRKKTPKFELNSEEFWKPYLRVDALNDEGLVKAVACTLKNHMGSSCRDFDKLAWCTVSAISEAIRVFVSAKQKAIIGGLGQFDYDLDVCVKFNPDPLLVETVHVAAKGQISAKGRIKNLGTEFAPDALKINDLTEILDGLPAKLREMGLDPEACTAVEEQLKESLHQK